MAPAVIEGKAAVHDGDTIYVNATSVRLWGVDAPELSEPYGRAARAALQDIIGNAAVVCTSIGASHKRTVARCRVRDVDIASELVKKGQALDCARFSGGYYRKMEPDGVRSRLKQKPYC